MGGMEFPFGNYLSSYRESGSLVSIMQHPASFQPPSRASVSVKSFISSERLGLGRRLTSRKANSNGIDAILVTHQGDCQDSKTVGKRHDQHEDSVCTAGFSDILDELAGKVDATVCDLKLSFEIFVGWLETELLPKVLHGVLRVHGMVLIAVFDAVHFLQLLQRLRIYLCVDNRLRSRINI